MRGGHVGGGPAPSGQSLGQSGSFFIALRENPSYCRRKGSVDGVQA